MAENRYKDAVRCSLSELLTPGQFRTVLYEQMSIPCGQTEIPVSVTLNKKTAGKLSFKVPWDGMLFGFARIRPFVKKSFGTDEAMLYINDWDDKFVVIFDLQAYGEKAFFVTADEVVQLLENCVRVPQQKSITPKSKGLRKPV